MQYINGGYIGRTLEIRPDDSRSLSGVWNINDHYDMRYQGMLQSKYNWNTTTVFCLKGGGIDGSKNIIDSTGKQIVINNGVTYSTLQSKYASSSLYFNGSSYLEIPSSSNTVFGANDFTIEWWEYVIDPTNPKTIFTNEFKGYSYSGILVGHNTTNRNFYISANGTSWAVNGESLGTFNLATWNHYALSRQGSSFRRFKNGTSVGTTLYAPAITNIENTWAIGHYTTNTPPAVLLNGYIEDFTITIGLAKYTGSFTPSEITS